MEAILDYLQMEGYWQYIWPAYGIAAAVLIMLLVSTLRSVHANEASLSELEKQRPRRRDRTASPATER